VLLKFPPLRDRLSSGWPVRAFKLPVLPVALTEQSDTSRDVSNIDVAGRPRAENSGIVGVDSIPVVHGIDGMLFINLAQEGQEIKEWWS
jgi:hypothetical protein